MVILKFVCLSFFLLSVCTALGPIGTDDYTNRPIETKETIKITFIGKLKECSDKCSATYEQQLKGFCRPSVNINGCTYTSVKDTTGPKEKAEVTHNACQDKCLEDHPKDMQFHYSVETIPIPVTYLE